MTEEPDTAALARRFCELAGWAPIPDTSHSLIVFRPNRPAAEVLNWLGHEGDFVFVVIGEMERRGYAWKLSQFGHPEDRDEPVFASFGSRYSASSQRALDAVLMAANAALEAEVKA